MARGKRPVTFRTRKLSLSAPMVLPWRRGGRGGRRRTTIPARAPASVLGPCRRSGGILRGEPGAPPRPSAPTVRRPTALSAPQARSPTGLAAPKVRSPTGLSAPKVRPSGRFMYIKRRGESPAAGFLGGGPDVVVDPGVERDEVAPGRSDLLQGARGVQPVRRFPAPA